MDECIHLPKPRDEHDAKHATPKPSCGWCAWLAEKARADEYQHVLETIVEESIHGGALCAELARDALEPNR